MLSTRAVLHGVVDGTFAARNASDVLAPGKSGWTADEHDKILAVRDDIAARLAKEVNRIEGQLTLMVSHLEGECESKVARLRARKYLLPLVLGFAAGVVLTLGITLV